MDVSAAPGSAAAGGASPFIDVAAFKADASSAVRELLGAGAGASAADVEAAAKLLSTGETEAEALRRLVRDSTTGSADVAAEASKVAASAKQRKEMARQWIASIAAEEDKTDEDETSEHESEDADEGVSAGTSKKRRKSDQREGGKRRRQAPTAPPAASARIAAGGDLGSDEVVLELSVSYAAEREKQSSTRTQDVLVLGSQPITALRSAVRCVFDDVAAKCGNDAKGAFAYIEGVFYNDNRDHGATDLAAPLMDFASKRRMVLPGLPLQSASTKSLSKVSMEDTTFAELCVRIGNTYVYTHQGLCEHAFRVVEVRRLRSTDPQQRAAYPARIREARIWDRKCGTCKKLNATKVTYRDCLAKGITSHSAAFFCDECYELLHYDASHQKLCEHEVYSVFPGQ